MAARGPGRLHTGEGGFTLLEALVAVAILAIALLGLASVRTEAVVTAAETRNLKLARELAERVLSQVEAGHHEVLESGIERPFDRYPHFSWVVLVGEQEVAHEEGRAASLRDSFTGEGHYEQFLWRQERQRHRRQMREGEEEFQAQAPYDPYAPTPPEEDPIKRLRDTAPSEDEMETVAVVVYYPDVRGTFEDGGQRARFALRTRVSTLALSGLTPRQVEDRAGGPGAMEGSTEGTMEGAGGGR